MPDARSGEQFAQCGDVELCYETFGDASATPILMVMGLGAQMLDWPEGLCAELAERGFFVIRYDNRDVGRSTKFKGHPPPSRLELLTRRFGSVAYTLEDLADDGLRLLDHLGIERAHVAGASMGGMIAQVMAGRHTDRVLTLTSIMSTPGGWWAGRPALQVLPLFLATPARSREEAIERRRRALGLFGSTGFEIDYAEADERAGRSWDRDPSASGTARQLAAILSAGNRTRDLKRIEAPTLVIHGTADRLITPSGGVATARAIKGARLMLIDGMGHHFPRGAWPRIIDGIVENAARAAETEVTAWQRAS